MDQSFDPILFETKGQVAQITLNRPDAANSINLELAKAFMTAAIRCDQDPDIRAVLIKGAGRFFCTGGDLKAFYGKGDGLPAFLKEVTAYLHGAMSILARMDAPTVAAVHGSAAGAGLSIAAGCDISLAAESAQFTMAYTGVGFSPDGGVTHFLPRMIGWKKAMELMLTSRRLSAREAQEIGIITRVTSDDQLLADAMATAQALAEGPTQAYGKVKRLLQSSITESFESQMSLESRDISAMAATDDLKNGLAAFIRKEKPVFKGK